MDSLQKVFYFPINGSGEEVGEPIPVEIGQDGIVDISQLPDSLRRTLESFGVPDEMRLEQLHPKDGERFLQGLIRATNGYMRFRSRPEKR